MPNPISNSISNSSCLHSIDTLCGLVMLLMLFDHVRETFFLHHQVGDLTDVASIEPALFLSRTLAHLCAPVFVFPTGLSALLYGEKHQGRRAVSVSLFKRGLLLVALEPALMNFAWTFQLSSMVIYLQAIWAIGLSMLVLAAPLWLPCPLLAAPGVLLVVGHNLLDPSHSAFDSAWHLSQAALHDRDWIKAGDALCLCTSYPLLPWIGVIVLGCVAGNWFSDAMPATMRRRYLLMGGDGPLLGSILPRLLNGYGERPWAFGETPVITPTGSFNIIKYPPPLLFPALTLGIGLLLLAWFERLDWNGRGKVLVAFGGAPTLFYLLHFYLLKLLCLLMPAIWGADRGDYFGFSSVSALWLCSTLLVVALYPVVHWFAGSEARRRNIVWLKCS